MNVGLGYWAGTFVKRREFIGLLGGAAVSAPFPVRAQRASMPLVGFLHGASPSFLEQFVDALRKGLNAARAAKAATSTIPIVFVSAADPVRAGLVASLSRPEGNVTGINMIGAMLEAKRLELLREVVPQASIIGVLINPKYPAAKIQTQEVQEATARLGVKLVLLNASNEPEVDAAFAGFVEQKVGAILACNDPFFGSYREKLASLALGHKLPAMSFRREFAEVGGLLSYGAVFEEGYRQAGVYAARILKGAKTTDLPVMQPTKFEMVVNLKTAKALGLVVAESFLLRADEIIE
jgi:putative tryptophan/tyrosine transport system substrate-binding protein